MLKTTSIKVPSNMPLVDLARAFKTVGYNLRGTREGLQAELPIDYLERLCTHGRINCTECAEEARQAGIDSQFEGYNEA